MTVFWAAFFSDTEHEVEKVTSGHRITLTYNLYVEEEDPSRLSDKEISQNMIQQNGFYKLLSQQLRRKEFYPDGGILGFGLKHQYPFPTPALNRYGQDTATVDSMVHYLKSTDRLLHTIGVALGLKTELKVTCHTDRFGLTIMTSKLCDFPESTYEDPVGAMTEEFGSEVIKSTRGAYDEAIYKGEVKKVDWVTPMSSKNVKKYDWIAYGNEVVLRHSYGYCCLIMRIPKWPRRDSAV